MGDELRTLLRAEINAERPPPIGGLVGESLRHGRRLRRRRRERLLGAAAVGAAAVFALAITAPWAVHAPPRHAAARPSVIPSTVESGAPAASGEPTPEAMLYLLTQLLPKGKTGGYGRSADGRTVQLTFDTGRGPARIRLSLGPVPRGFCDNGCQILANGDYLQVTGNASACGVEVGVEHRDGAVVQITSSSCPASMLPPEFPRHALSLTEAVAIASDNRWSFTMDPRLAEKGAAAFPHLATIS